MKGKTSVPAIRFAGFTGNWEQRKLEEYLEVSSEKNFEGVFTRADVLSVSGEIGIVNQIEFQGRSFAGASVLNYGVVGTGDVVYTKSPLKTNPYGIIKTNKGKPGIVSTLYAVYHAKPDIFPDFVQCYFEQDARVNNYLHPLVNKGAKNDMKVSAENALKGTVIFPEYEEQMAIVAFFRHLDHLITLHQSKHSQLSTVKKSMLEKMFPKAGATVPEIRFAGFTGDWEQRKLGEVYQVNNERNEGQYPVEKTLSIATMTFNAQGNGAKEASLAKYKVLRVGDIAFEGHISKEFRYGRFVLNNLENGIMSPRFTTLRPVIKQNYNFWEYYIHSERVMKSRLVNATKAGTMMNELVPDDLFSQFILEPSLDEQAKIGAFLKELDHLITLHQRELEKLRNIKKSCLEKMFV